MRELYPLAQQWLSLLMKAYFNGKQIIDDNQNILVIVVMNQLWNSARYFKRKKRRRILD